jgi:hypothetical protein
MAASLPRDKRPAVWPWLVMPFVVFLAFYVLNRVRQHPGDTADAPVPTPVPAAAPAAEPSAGSAQYPNPS